MMRWRRTTACERAAQWISLDLDDELGRLERAALARHLGRCAGCRAASAEIGGVHRAAARAAADRARRRPSSSHAAGASDGCARSAAAASRLPPPAAAWSARSAPCPHSRRAPASSLGFRNARAAAVVRARARSVEPRSSSTPHRAASLVRAGARSYRLALRRRPTASLRAAAAPSSFRESDSPGDIMANERQQRERRQADRDQGRRGRRRLPERAARDLLGAADHAARRRRLVAEVQQHLGDDRVRAVAMDSTDGIARGTDVVDTGAPISVPVGDMTLGRVWNVLGDPVDGKGRPAGGQRALADPPRSAARSRTSRRRSRSSRPGSRSST